jgi:tight adherence protein C
MAFGFAFALFLSVGVATFCLAMAVWAPQTAFSTRLHTLLRESAAPVRDETLPSRVEDALTTLSKTLPKSPSEVSKTRALLMQAGYREGKHLTCFFGIRALALLGALFFVVTTGLAFKSPFLMVAFAAFGYILPGFILKRIIKRRQQRIRLSLPDALDLTIICVEAGLGIDQALQRVSQELNHVHKDLCEEFTLLNLEIRAGKSRMDALRNLAERTAVDDLRALVAVLVQTDRFGTSIAQALRVHSDSLRTERRQRAEEQAAKTTIKMVPVLVFFVFPSMFFVSLGPAAIILIRNLLPAIEK